MSYQPLLFWKKPDKIKTSYITNYDVDAWRMNIGADAGLTDLHDNAFTVEGWFGATLPNAWWNFAVKGANAGNYGWSLGTNASGALYCTVACASGTFYAGTAYTICDGSWKHLAMTWDDAGDRKTRAWINGSLVGTSAAHVGLIISDVGRNMIVNLSTGVMKSGWVRVSNSVRYSAAFTPASRFRPPPIDANTVAQWNMKERYGTLIDNAEGTATRDGTLVSAKMWGRG
jgi:hypothetical protein